MTPLTPEEMAAAVERARTYLDNAMGGLYPNERFRIARALLQAVEERDATQVLYDNLCRLDLAVETRLHDEVDRLTRERDEARAEVENLRKIGVRRHDSNTGPYSAMELQMIAGDGSAGACRLIGDDDRWRSTLDAAFEDRDEYDRAFNDAMLMVASLKEQVEKLREKLSSHGHCNMDFDEHSYCEDCGANAPEHEPGCVFVALLAATAPAGEQGKET